MHCGQIIVLVNIVLIVWGNNEMFCEKDQPCESTINYRYLFYDVNPPEGFNLRRDVYLRFAVFAHNLQKSSDQNLQRFKLVLPPWTNLYHWRKTTQEYIPWSHFFDMDSLQKFASVIEMYEFFEVVSNKYTALKIDEVYILQHFDDMFESGNFEDRMAVESCNKQIQTTFFHYSNITSNNIKCLSFHGHASQLSTILKNSKSKTVLFDHAEVALHDRFGDEIYWKARRSMRFNKDLIEIAAKFRKKYLNSDDQLDGTLRPIDWRNEKSKRDAKGGPYLSVHLRRRDFVWGRPTQVPTIEHAAEQIIQLLKKLGLSKVFIATDSVDKEYKELEMLLKGFEVYQYETIKETEGQAAVIDQIICSHAAYFVGTHESTFSFRIQEEREIMGFPIETTFNRLCGNDTMCERPSIWKIVY